MGKALNPYQAWLDIPPTEQPPDHYRLLGVRRFETDPQIIKRAAEMRIAFVRQKAAGSNQEIAKWLIAQIAAAHACLTVPGPREAYDQALLGRRSAIPAIEPPRLVKPIAQPTETTNAIEAASRPWKRHLTVAVAAAVMVVLTGTMLMIYSAGRSESGLNHDTVATGAASKARGWRDSPEVTRQTDAPAKKTKPSRAPAELPQHLNTSSAENVVADATARARAASQLVPKADPAAAETVAPGAENPEATAPLVQASPAAAGVPTAAPVNTQTRSPAAIESHGSATPAIQPWLRPNERGEPCEVTLADGTVIKLDVYGDEYEGQDYRPPMPAAKGTILVDYRRLRWDGLFGGGIKLDLKNRKIYWGDTLRGPHPSSIRRANLNGTRIETIVGRHPLRPSDLALDLDSSTIFWVNSGRENGDGRSIECADFGGSRQKVIIEPISVTGGIAVDSTERKLYYVDGDNLMRCELDGSDQRRILATRKPGTLLIDSASRTIYWTTNMHVIRKASLDGRDEADAVNIGEFHGHITRAALDAKAGKLYWTHSNPGRIQRANMDGSQIEDVVVGDVTFSGLDVDTENGDIYWMENFPDERGAPVTLVRRAKLAQSLSRTKKPAPALIKGMLPSTVVAGGALTVRGSHFQHTQTVMFIDDGTGGSTDARFTVVSGEEMSIVVPRMSQQCRNPVLVVEGTGGVTVTLPRTSRIARRDAVDRFHPDNEFTYIAPADSMVKAERAVVFAMKGGGAYSGAHGQNSFFVKNGAMSGAKKHPNNRIYFEPFALVSEIDKPGPGTVLIPCAAIRPSFLEKLPEYKETEDAPQ